jgi:hypothetical protein
MLLSVLRLPRASNWCPCIEGTNRFHRYLGVHLEPDKAEGDIQDLKMFAGSACFYCFLYITVCIFSAEDAYSVPSRRLRSSKTPSQLSHSFTFGKVFSTFMTKSTVGSCAVCGLPIGSLKLVGAFFTRRDDLLRENILVLGGTSLQLTLARLSVGLVNVGLTSCSEYHGPPTRKQKSLDRL